MIMSSKQVRANRITDIRLSDIKLGNKKLVKLKDSKEAIVPIIYNGKTLVCQTPFLEVWGPPKKTSYPNIVQLDTRFSGDSKIKIQKFYQFLEDIETHISNLVSTYGSKWFNNKNIIIRSFIRESDEKDVFYLRWPIEIQPNILVDEQKKPLDCASIIEHDQIRFIFEIPSIWIDENHFGLVIFVQKMMLRRKQEIVRNDYVFADSESENEDNDQKNIINFLTTEYQYKSQDKSYHGKPEKPEKYEKHDKHDKSEKKKTQLNAHSVVELVDEDIIE
jgi:hypothetical protein